MTDAQRKRRLAIFGGVVLVAIAAVAVVIAVSSGGRSSSNTKTPAKAGTPLAGIPQTGNVLGATSAKATMMVFADMQCPFCREFETQAFPSIVKRYVKTGKLRIVFQPISFIGSDSLVAAKAAAAASAQSRMFEYVSAFYANQGTENTGYVTDSFLSKIAKASPGLDVSKWQSGVNSEAGVSILSQAETAAKTAGVNSTPTFMVAKKGQPLKKFQPSALTASAFYSKLDSLTA